MLLTAAQAQAAFGTDALQVRLSAALSHDSNVFRLPDGVPAFTPDGGTARGDLIRTTTEGVDVALPFARQVFLFNYTWSQIRYANFTDLNYDGLDMRSVLKWELGPWLHGELGYLHSVIQPGFANAVNQSPNLRTTNQTFLNADYPFHANWDATFSAMEAKTTNSDVASQVSDVHTSMQSYGLRYTTGLGNYAGVRTALTDATYPNQLVSGGVVVNNDYRQTDTVFLGGWEIGAAATLSGNIGRTTREPTQPSLPTVTGRTSSLLFTWLPTAATRLVVEYSRNLDIATDVTTANSALKTWSVTPSWAATPTLNVLGNLRHEVRKFLDDPATLAPARSDTTVSAGLTVVYTTPIRGLFLNFAAQHEQRTSNEPGLDYNTTIYSAIARWGF